MKGLAITQDNLTNQQGVVKNEVKVNVLNRPYGGFPWLDMPQYANTNWFNAHNFYGELDDLDAATLEDVQAFFNTYYSPNNAALAIVGDFNKTDALEMIKKYFEEIPSATIPPLPDISEPRQEEEKTFSKDDALAERPAVAFAYHMPDRNTPEYYAMGLIDQILLQGEDSRLHQSLVKKNGYTGNVNGGINLLGNMFNYNGPMLWLASLFYDQTTDQADIMAAVDTEIEKMSTDLIDQATLNRAIIKLRSNYYDNVGGSFGIGRADLLCTFALFDNNPERINSLEAEFKKVTPELIRKTVTEYLRKTNRTILTVNPTKTTQP